MYICSIRSILIHVQYTKPRVTYKIHFRSVIIQRANWTIFAKGQRILEWSLINSYRQISVASVALNGQPRASGRVVRSSFPSFYKPVHTTEYKVWKGPSETNGQRETEKQEGRERERESFCSLAGRAVACLISEQIKRRNSHIRHGRVIRGIIN